jgi:predicted RND superfamily exporter protein
MDQGKKDVMNKLLESLAHFFSGFPDLVRNRKWLVLGIFLTGTVLSFMGMQRLKFDMTIEGWFSDDDPTLVALDGYHAQFGSEDHYFIVYKPKDGNVFSAKSLELLRRIQNDFLNYRASLPDTAKSPLDHIVKVNTLLNASILEAHDDVLTSRHLIGDTVPTSAAALKDLTRIAEAQKSFPLQYFSKDHQYGGILLETNFGAIPLDAPEGKAAMASDKDLGSFAMKAAAPHGEERVRFKKTDLGDYLSLMKSINTILDKPEYAGHFEYHPVGNGPTTEYSLALVKEMGMLNGLTLLIMILLLWFVHRSLSAVVWSLSIIILAVIWTLGISGWIGMKASPFVMLTIMLILTVGVCDTVHLIAGYNFQRRLGVDKWSAVKTVYHESAAACLLTAFTTMVGLQASNFTSIVPMEVFALMTGLGVGVTLVITLFLLPLMLDLWSPNPLGRHARARIAGSGKASRSFIPDISAVLDGFLARVFPFVDRQKNKIAGVSLMTFLVCVAGMTQLRVNSDQIKQFPESAPIRKSYEIVDQMMGGHFVEIFWNLGKESAFQDPKVLKVMDGLQRTLERKYDLIIRTSSLADVVKDSYMKLNGGSPDKYVIPDDPNALSQTLFLFNNANGDARHRLVSDDYSKSHISIQMHNAGSYELTRKFDKMREDIDAALAQIRQDYPDAKVTITGLFTLMMEGAQYVTENGLLSFLVVAALVGTILLFMFNSFKAGLIALAPNMIPFVMTFGTMGLMRVSLDFYTLMLASEVIGISVDDSVHYIAHYRERYIETGDIRIALKATINEAGRSVTFTTMVLALGFGVMAFASNPSTAHFGEFGFLAIVVGFLQDLLLLPAMILIFKLRFKRDGKAHAVAVPFAVGEVAT